MGIAYRLDRTMGLTLTVFDGKITGDEWRAVVTEIFANPEWPPGRLNLTDLRTADALGLTAADRGKILEMNTAQAHKLVGMKSAAVSGAHFEAAREFEREDQTSGMRLIPFDDLGPACAWLGLDLQSVRTMINELRDGLRES
jgi:hypothetical protein